MGDDFFDRIEEWRDSVGRKPHAAMNDAMTDDQERDMVSGKVNVWVDSHGTVHASHGGHHATARTPRRAMEILPGLGD